MDFLSIRKKARERAEAKEAEPRTAAAEPAPAAPEPAPPAAPPQVAPAPAAPPPPAETAPSSSQPSTSSFRQVRRGDRILGEEELAAGVLQERFDGLAPTSDGRFATWRPGFGPPPIEPEPHAWPAAPRAPSGPIFELETELEPMPEPSREPSREPAARDPASSPEPFARPRPAAPPADPLDLFFYRPDEDAAAVPLLGGGGGEEPGLPPAEAVEEYLIFRVGQEELAVAIGSVREVLRAPSITEVPRAPAHVLGVMTVRGEVVAVMDARSRLGLGGTEATASRILVVDPGDGPLGLLVDQVTSVVRLPKSAIEPCPQGIAASAADCVTGIGRHRERLFMVVDVALLLGGGGAPGRR
jgi:purine-binding chemotaxis protein CheW